MFRHMILIDRQPSMPRHSPLGAIKVRHLMPFRILQFPVAPKHTDLPLVLAACIGVDEFKLVAKETRSYNFKGIVVALDCPDLAAMSKGREGAMEQCASSMVFVLAIKQPTFRGFGFDAVNNGDLALFLDVTKAHMCSSA